MLDVFAQDVHLLDFARRRRGRGIGLADRHRRDVLQSRVARDGARLRAHELHAVVLLRIVTRRDHDAAAEPEVRRCEVDHLRAALPKIHDVAARLGQPLCERITDRGTREPYIMTDRHFLRAKQRGETASDTIGKLLVDLVRIYAAYIVCAKTFVRHCHNVPSS